MSNDLITIEGFIHSAFITKPTIKSPSFRLNIAVQKENAVRIKKDLERIMTGQGMPPGYIDTLSYPVIEDANSVSIPNLERHTRARLMETKAQVVEEDYAAPEYLKDTLLFIIRLGSVDRLGYREDDPSPNLPMLADEMYEIDDKMWSKTYQVPANGSTVKLVCQPKAYINKFGNQFSFNPNTLFIINRIPGNTGSTIPDKRDRFSAAGVDIDMEAVSDAFKSDSNLDSTDFENHNDVHI